MKFLMLVLTTVIISVGVVFIAKTIADIDHRNHNTYTLLWECPWKCSHVLQTIRLDKGKSYKSVETWVCDNCGQITKLKDTVVHNTNYGGRTYITSDSFEKQ